MDCKIIGDLQYLGVIPKNLNQRDSTNFLQEPTASCSRSDPVNSSSTKAKLNSTNFLQDPTASCSSSNLVKSKGKSSSNLVNLEGLVNSKGQLGSTSPQLGSTKNQLNSNKNQQPNCLSELGQQAKDELEVLVATGKSKDLLGKQITQLDVDHMSEKDIVKYYRIYQTAMAARVNNSFGKIAIQSYVKLASFILPIDDADNLYHDLRSDYIVCNEIDKWAGWLSLKMGSFVALASTSLITFGHCVIKKDIGNMDNSLIINDGNQPSGEQS